jgi:hypothetical protein
MIGLKAKVARSWLTAAGVAMAAQFRERLLERCKGEEEGRFITLTYRREPGETPQELYQRAKEDEHVRRFIRKLATSLGEDFTGRWMCKMEFQRGGWVHWHLLILGLGFTDWKMVERLWGHGFIAMKRMTDANIRYIAKYVAKGGEVPPFLLLERSRSVRVVRVSPGFWGDVEPPADSYVRKREPIAWSHEIDDETGELTEVPCTGPLPWYRCVGQMIEESERGVVMRDAETGVFGQVKVDAFQLFVALSKIGARVVGGSDGWLWFDSITMDDVREVGGLLSGLPSRAAGSPAAKPPLYLIGSPDPGKEVVTPRWLEWFFWWDFGWLDEPEVSWGVEMSLEEESS